MRTIIVTPEEVNGGLSKAYENFARKAGFEVDDNTMFDCTKIDVSKEVDDYFWDYYTKLGKEKGLSDGDINMAISMMMLNNGAKRKDDLESWTVVLDEDFVYQKESENE